jgi:hypothetical protein
MAERSITIRFFLTCLWSSLRGGGSPAAPAVQLSNPGSGCSPAVPAALSLGPLVPSDSLMRCNPSPCTNPFLLFII